MCSASEDREGANLIFKQNTDDTGARGTVDGCPFPCKLIKAS